MEHAQLQAARNPPNYTTSNASRNAMTLALVLRGLKKEWGLRVCCIS